MRFFHTAFALGAVVLASGCGHMPVTTMVRMRNFDFATFNPAALRVAVRVPDALRVRKDGARLSVQIEHEGSEPSTSLFTLQELKGPADHAALKSYEVIGTRMFVFTASAADAARIRSLQAEGRAYREAHPGKSRKSRLTINISADSCRTGPLPSGPLLTTTYVHPDPETGFLVFLRDVDLRKQVEEIGGSIEALVPECARQDLLAGIEE
jgi:hypothetical protein